MRLRFGCYKVCKQNHPTCLHVYKLITNKGSEIFISSSSTCSSAPKTSNSYDYCFASAYDIGSCFQ